MEERILLVGQAPGPRTDPRLPLYPVPSTSAGGRLQALMGLRKHEYLRLFERMNLLTEYPGAWQNGDAWPLATARVVAASLLPLLSGRRVVLVGRNVAEAFRLGELPFHQWTDHPTRRLCPFSQLASTCQLAVVPHLSGRNRWYNDPAAVATARAFWSATLQSRKLPQASCLLQMSPA